MIFVRLLETKAPDPESATHLRSGVRSVLDSVPVFSDQWHLRHAWLVLGCHVGAWNGEEEREAEVHARRAQIQLNVAWAVWCFAVLRNNWKKGNEKPGATGVAASFLRMLSKC